MLEQCCGTEMTDNALPSSGWMGQYINMTTPLCKSTKVYITCHISEALLFLVIECCALLFRPVRKQVSCYFRVVPSTDTLPVKFFVYRLPILKSNLY